MTGNALDSISFGALYKKSAGCIERALYRKRTGYQSPDSFVRELSGQETAKDFIEYQLWASIGLELLAKAALAYHHPCLVVDSNSQDSMFAAAAIESKTNGSKIEMEKIRTISAQTAYERLKDLVSDYDSEAYNFCLKIARIRNAEIHSAASLFDRMESNWEGMYWHTCGIILVHMKSSLNEWLGEEYARQAFRVLVATTKASKAKETAVRFRIENARKKFNENSGTKRAMISGKANEVDLKTGLKDFAKDHEIAWNVVCPACRNRAIMAGSQTIGSIFDFNKYVLSASEPAENFKRTFAPSEFICVACDLRFSDSDEIRFAGLYETHQE